MKKNTFLWLLLVLPSIIFSQNLISDGTFSTQTGAITTGTTSWAGYNAQVLGSAHADDPLVGNINNAEGALRQDITVVPETTYKVTFDYRWVSTGGYDMTVRFRRQTAPAGNLSISNVTGGTLNGGSDGLIVSTTPDIWMNASFHVTVPAGVSLARLQFFKSNGNRPFRVDNVSVRKLATFDGSTNSDWATADNWDTSEIPNDDDIIIPSGQNVVVSSSTSATGGYLEVDGGGSLTINGGGSLDLNGISKIDNSVSIGSITYNRSLTVDKWHLVSAPVVGETYNDTWVAENNIASGTGSNRGVATFQNGTADPTTGQWVYLQSGGSGTFNSSTGYSLRSDTGGNVSFTGTYPTGARPASVTDANTNKFNLVGNPYPLYLTVANFFTNNTLASGKLTEETLWIWNQATNAYVPKTSGSDGTFQIAPGQAFFISSGNGSDIIFYQFNGTGATDTFLKNNRTELSLSIKNGQNVLTTDLHYINEGTNDFDNGYDASLFGGVKSNLTLYTGLVNNVEKKLARQVLSLNDMENTVIPVGLKIGALEEVTFSLEGLNLPEGLKVFLEDKQENTFTRLDQSNTNYKTSTSEAIDGVGRFFLHTKSSALNTIDSALNNVNVFRTNSSNIRIVGLANEKVNFKMFNILGKKVMHKSFLANGSKDISLPRLAKGVYLMQLETENGNLNKKIILE